MGMYTEIRVNARLRKDVPEEVLRVLRDLIDNSWAFTRTAAERAQGLAARRPEVEPGAVGHEFFYCDRWPYVLTMGSAYFSTDPWQRLEQGPDGSWHLEAVANLKNYNSEIRKFADWLRPHCQPQEAPFVTEEYELWNGARTRYFTDGRVEPAPYTEEL